MGMTEEMKLILAQMQVNNVIELLKGNEYEQYMINKLISVHYELDRQITNHRAKKEGTGGQLSEVST
jgi:NOL1/NOP2/fmu family ribosome biogenesis protein